MEIVAFDLQNFGFVTYSFIQREQCSFSLHYYWCHSIKELITPSFELGRDSIETDLCQSLFDDDFSRITFFLFQFIMLNSRNTMD